MRTRAAMVLAGVRLFLLLAALETAAAQDGSFPYESAKCDRDGLTASSVPSADFAACGMSETELWGVNSDLYVTKKCTDAACQRIYAHLAAAYPGECEIGYGELKKLHQSVLDPLTKRCAELKRATTAPPTPQTTESTASSSPTTTQPPSSTTSAPSATTVLVSPATPAVETDTSSTSGGDVASTNSSTSNGNTAAESSAPRNDTTTLPPIVTEIIASSPKASSPITAWVIGAIAALGFTTLIVFCWLRLGRRRDTQPPAGSHTSVPATDTTGSTPYVAIDRSTPPPHHHEMDTLLLQDRKIAAWRLFSTQVRDIKFLGKGSHAFVHLVKLNDGTLLASKRLALDQATPKHLQQLLTEVHIVATLSHASVVQFKGVTWTDAMDFQVLFEYMRRGDLRHYLDKQRQASSPSTTEWTPLKFQIALSVAEGLAYAHSFTSPLVHRDLKSRNILLTEELRAKISDFGVSRFQSENDTMTTGVGTNRWLAPEVLVGGGAYNEKCDIYSFGVVMTELDTHEVPLEKEIAALRSLSSSIVRSRYKSELSVLQDIAKGRLRPSMTSSAPAELRRLVKACLSIEARDRPGALELSYRLRKLASNKS